MGDLTYQISGSTMLFAAGTIFYWLGREKYKEWKEIKKAERDALLAADRANKKLIEDHMNECNLRRVNHARLEEQVSSLEDKLDSKVKSLEETISVMSDTTDKRFDAVDKSLNVMESHLTTVIMLIQQKQNNKGSI